LNDSYIHLTNFSVQKYHSDFSKQHIGNEVSFDDFQDALNSSSKTNYIKVKDIYNKIADIVKITFKCVKDTINTQNRKHSFEIFGFDFIVDKDVNVFLLEVNTNPGLELSSPLITKLVPRMIDDALRLSVDLLFPNETEKDKNKTYNSKFPVDNYSNSENMYDFLGNINEK